MGDVSTLAVGLLRLAGDGVAAQAMGRAWPQRIEQHFSLPVMVAAYQSVYERALRRAS